VLRTLGIQEGERGSSARKGHMIQMPGSEA
jgi:hypothetical protein